MVFAYLKHNNLQRENGQNWSIKLRYAHFKELLLVEMLEQPIRMLKMSVAQFYAEILISVWVGVPCIANTGSKQILMHISYLQQ